MCKQPYATWSAKTKLIILSIFQSINLPFAILWQVFSLSKATFTFVAAKAKEVQANRSEKDRQTRRPVGLNQT